VATEPRAAIIRRLRGTPIGKWPDHEYARLRQTNHYTSPKGENYSELFWTRYQEKTYDDLYANATYRVAPMRRNPLGLALASLPQAAEGPWRRRPFFPPPHPSPSLAAA
jgi:hypothetical protein